MSMITHGFAGLRARIRDFWAHYIFTRGHNIKPAPVPVGTKKNPYPYSIGFLPRDY